jgi:two-component system, response regulator YesN
LFKVLLVDDEVLDIEGLQKLIPWNELGIEISGTANSAYKAMELLNTNSVDLLISDIKMPIMSGLELFGKAKEKNPTLRVIFISGYQDFQYAKKAIQMSANGYVLKPIDYDELIGLIKNVIALIEKENHNNIFLNNLERSREFIKTEWSHKNENGNIGSANIKIKGHNRKLISDIGKYVDEHLDGKLSLKNVANHFAFTPNYLGLLFKEETDEYFTDFLVRKKLEKASILLKDTNLKIYEIADSLGYSNMNYFSKQFKEYYGITPLDYKKEG